MRIIINILASTIVFTSTMAFAAPKKPVVEKAPDTYKVQFETTKGKILFDCTRKWAPLGADRFHQLVKEGFFKDIAFFRVLDGFVAQFGIHGDPKVSAKWRDSAIQDDPVIESNKAGYLTFAMGGKDTRTTQLFINLDDNANLDSQGFSPFCKITEGIDITKKLYSKYGEGAPRGKGPAQDLIQLDGNKYLKAKFPKLDYIISASIKK